MSHWQGGLADNIRSSLSRYSTPRKFLNLQFHFNYIVPRACKSTEGPDDFAAFKMAKRCQKRRLQGFPGR